MIIQMSQPWCHPETGVWYFRSRVPSDLLASVGDQRLTVEVGGLVSTVKLAPIVKLSLRTKDKAEARSRHASVQTQIQQRWSAARRGVVTLQRRDIEALAGEWYRDLVSANQDDPGTVDDWDIFQDLLRDGLAYFDPDGDGYEREPYDPKEGCRTLAKHFNINEFVAAKGLNLDPDTRTKLIESVAVALVFGAETLKRRARRDYGPDEVAKRFPIWRPERHSVPSREVDARVRLGVLLEDWAKESRPARATLDLWRTYVASFARYIGRDDARSITRADVVKWKQHLLELGNSPKTINDGKLGALRAVFRWALDNELISLNPATKVSVRRSRKPGDAMRGFEKSEAAVILAAALRSNNPIYRWVPLLCAQSGARVSEVCQLRREDVRRDDGISFMHFTAAAGSLKNATSERTVPLHPDVIHAGFLDFVAARGPGPLFYDPKRRRTDAKKPQPKIVAKNVARWVHSLGIEVGRQFRKDPNHAWRHFFRTVARDVPIEESVVNAIQGHAGVSVGQRYGETLLRTKAKAIAQIALPGVSSRAGAGSQS